MTRRDWLWVGLLAIAAVPFQTLWLDFEVARRGVVMIVAAGFALTLPRRWPVPIPTNAKWFGALVLWLFVAGTWPTTNPGEALLRVAWFAALWIVLMRGAVEPAVGFAGPVAVVSVAVSIYGIAQAFGLEWPSGYARSQAVSSLGNRNVASEFVAVCVAVVLASGERCRKPLVLAGVAIASLYLGINGSRSGLVALAGASACVVVFRRGHASNAIASVLALACAGLGYGCGPAKQATPPTAFGAAETPVGAPSTIEVRAEIWRSGLEMVSDATLCGHGAGQFRYEYPRYRSAREIDLSSFGRQFASFVATAHNDHVEFAVEGGVPGVALWIGFLLATFVAVWRGGSRLHLAPLVAFALLASVRSPTTNGPAALVAFLWFGSSVSRHSTRAEPRARAPLVVVGIATTFVGVATLAGQFCIAEFRAIPPGARTERAPWAERASTFHPTESRFCQLGLRNRWRPGDPGAREAYSSTRSTRERLLGLDPNNPTALFYLAEFAHAAGDAGAAEALLERILELDPPNPEARLLLGVRRCVEGDVESGLETLYTELHPALRVNLSNHLRDLAAAVGSRDPAAASRLEREHRLVAAIDSLLDATTRSHPPLLATDDDHRTIVVVACRVLARGDRAAAEARAPATLDLDAPARTLLAPLLDRLRELPAWRTALADA